MVEFINGITGTQMWVADDRVEEYKAAGHKPAAISSALKEPAEEKPVKKTKKATTKK